MTRKDSRYAIKRTGTGLGLFALETIPAGKRLIEYTGRLISNEEVDRRKNGKYFFGLNTKWSLDGTPRSNLARYINHSCSPNAVAYVSRHRVWIWSKRVIKPGEEITYDYGKEYFDVHLKPVGCKCKKCAPETRGKKRRRKS
ncbi:MAG: SET domain-containing protein [Acidobacteria bacterium]|nr:SET domain-containing protein [Acidobacteriota bacterium]MCA1640598.1 SET domain-containing protein [Acidobacteriota bacterium]